MLEKLARDKEEADRRAAEDRARQREAEKAARDARDAEIAAEIAEVVSACALGDFSRRIDNHGKEGVLLELCEGVNKIGSATEESLNDFRSALKAISRGDLTYRSSARHDGVSSEISESHDATISSLAGIVGRIHRSGAQLRDSADAIGGVTNNLAHKAEKNAATLEETTAAIQQIAASIQDTAKSANGAQEQATSAMQAAENGASVVTKTTEAMRSIEEESAKIAEIVEVIDGIAFQTNLLALNAGVEAARAGESGRGFAVVATEVRDLAARSSSAAKDISQLISESTRNVKEGVRLADESGDALGSIVSTVAELLSRFDAIAGAADEQSSSVSEISVASSELDQTTQQNATMFERTTSNINDMRAEIEALLEAASIFKISSDAQTPMAAAAAARAA